MSDRTALAHLGAEVFRLAGGVNCAVVACDDGGAILVDTGGDREHGRRLARACHDAGLVPRAILTTHAHADHYGGNDYLVRNLGLPVYAPRFEAAIMQNPLLQPVYLYGGAKPIAELTTKWMLARPSPVDEILEPGPVTIGGRTLRIVDVSGHAHVQYAVEFDGVLLAADALFGPEVLERYPLPFGQDVGAQITSARMLLEHEADITLPGHGEPTDALEPLARANLAAFERATAAVEAQCDGRSTDAVVTGSCAALGVRMGDLARYHLNRTTVLAYLAELAERGRVRVALDGETPCWTRT